MFARRQQLPILKRILNFFWPQRGWKRAGLYYWRRFARTRGTPHAVATGFAAGFCVSFTPFIGLHVLLGLFFSWVLRGNYVASLIGTLVFNPLTALPIIALTYEVGLAFMSVINLEAVQKVPDIHSIADLYNIVTNNFLTIFLPWLVGGVLSCLLLYPFAYMFGIFLVHLRDKAKAQKRVL